MELGGEENFPGASTEMAGVIAISKFIKEYEKINEQLYLGATSGDSPWWEYWVPGASSEMAGVMAISKFIKEYEEINKQLYWG